VLRLYRAAGLRQTHLGMAINEAVQPVGDPYA